MASGRGVQFGLNKKLTLIFASVLLVLVADAVAGLWLSWSTVSRFDMDVMPLQAEAVDVVAMEAEFKKQVQEWKDTLLRGKSPDALDKYWTNFQAREADVRRQGDHLTGRIADAEVRQLLEQFVSAHKTMGDAYRQGLQRFKDAGRPAEPRRFPTISPG